MCDYTNIIAFFHQGSSTLIGHLSYFVVLYIHTQTHTHTIHICKIIKKGIESLLNYINIIPLNYHIISYHIIIRDTG